MSTPPQERTDPDEPVLSADVNELLVITGQSGAGRSQVGNVLEDLGWYVVDNMPLSLVGSIAALEESPKAASGRLALSVGAETDPARLIDALDTLREDRPEMKVAFLEANDDSLVARYESTRRPHPFAEGRTLGDAIRAERESLTQIREIADLVIDTTDLNVHQLKARIVGIFANPDLDSTMQVTVTSFGFKHGLPRDVDLVIDCRFLPNPYWNETLRPLRGTDAEVRDFVFDFEGTSEFLERLDALLKMLLPAYVAEGKSYLTVAFGCTGGHHRSVAIAEEIAARLTSRGFAPLTIHRDLKK